MNIRLSPDPALLIGGVLAAALSGVLVSARLALEFLLLLVVYLVVLTVARTVVPFSVRITGVFVLAVPPLAGLLPTTIALVSAVALIGSLAEPEPGGGRGVADVLRGGASIVLLLAASLSQMLSGVGPGSNPVATFTRMALALAVLRLAHCGVVRAPATQWRYAVRLTAVVGIGSAAMMVAGVQVVELSDSQRANFSTADGAVRAIGWVTGPNEMGFIGVMLLLAGVVLLQQRTGDRADLWAWAAAGGGAAVVALSLSRTSIAVAALGLVVCVLQSIFLRGRSTSFGMRLGALLLAALVVVTTSPTLLGGRDLFGRGDDGSAVYRADVRRVLVERALDGQWSLLGSGFTNGNSVPFTELTRGANVDNTFFYVLATIGAIGVVALLVVLVSAVHGVLSRAAMALPFLVAFYGTFYLENSIAWVSALLVMAFVLGVVRRVEEPVGAEQRALPAWVRQHQPTAHRAGRSP